MKANGIIVYTVGFQLYDPTAIATLGQLRHRCQPRHSTPTTAAQLRQAFRDIAISITRLRLTS